MLTIVTVTYNAENKIRKTIESVISQSYNEYEYFVVDGRSTDSTLAIASEYEKIFENKGIKYAVFSEPDLGIYDAMNKSLQYTSSDWIFFLNAGDTFHNSDVLTNVFSYNTDNIDVVYGNILALRRFKKIAGSAGEIEEITERMPFCHQASFLRRSILEKYRFNIDLKICADYDLYLKLYIDGYKFLKINLTVVDYPFDGVSNMNMDKTFIEVQKVRIQNGVIKQITFNQKIKIVLLGIKSFIKRTIGYY